jgi:hypothetical protein
MLTYGIPVDGDIVHEKAKKVAGSMQIETILCQVDRFIALKILGCCMKQWLEEALPSTPDVRHSYLQGLSVILEGCKPWDTQCRGGGHFYNCLLVEC